MIRRTTRLATLLVVATAGTAALGACTYVERERPPQQATVVVPQQPAMAAPAPSATVIAPAPQPTVTVRPSY